MQANYLMVNDLFHHLPQPKHSVLGDRRAFEWINVYLFERVLYGLKCSFNRICGYPQILSAACYSLIRIKSYQIIGRSDRWTV